MKTLIKNARIVNEGEIFFGHIEIKNEIISKIHKDDSAPTSESDFSKIIDADGKYLFPGVIDDQVHFREPGLTHKAEIYTESKAAVAGGVTSFMEMPNTNPQTTSIEELEKKHKIAKKNSLANYSFYFGATNDNIEEIRKIDPTKTPGVKVFMGSSTGNMLVDKLESLEKIFRESPVLVATHCEDEKTIKENTKKYHQKFGDEMPMKFHPEIRTAEACYKSSSLAVEIAKKHGTRLHVLHISSAKELELFDAGKIEDKKITAEVCVHHLYFDENDYEKFGTRIKWNPAIKSSKDKEELFNALLSNKLDVVATDHAPHTIDEKNNHYFKAPSGGPLVQHSLNVMFDFYQGGKISLETVIEKMCHAPAKLFGVEYRGFIREGYFADLVLFDAEKEWTVSKKNILYKCGWSPFKGKKFKGIVSKTFVNGNLVFDDGEFFEQTKGKALSFRKK